MTTTTQVHNMNIHTTQFDTGPQCGYPIHTTTIAQVHYMGIHTTTITQVHNMGIHITTLTQVTQRELQILWV